MIRWPLVALALVLVGACATPDVSRGATSGIASTSTSTTTSTTSTTTSTAPSTTPPTTAPPTTSATAPPRTTTTAQHSDVPEGFCAGLAVESASITLALEELVASDATEATHRLTHLRATTALLGWIDEHAPADLGADSGLLAEVYADIDRVLADLDPGTVTEARLRNALFGALMDSPTSGADLDEAAGRVAAWVDDSCGSFPMIAFVADLFAAARQADGDEFVFEYPGER